MPSKKRSKKTVKKQKKNKSKSNVISTISSKTSCIPHALLDFEDVIETLFSYLDYSTLCVVQHVCRLWQKKAHERLLKNHPPFCMDLPVLYCEDVTHLLHDQDNCIAKNRIIHNLLMTLPEKVVIFFTDGSFPKQFRRVEICTSDNSDNVDDDYLKFLPLESIAVLEFIYVDNKEICGTKNLMTALCFPKIPPIKIRSSIVTESRMDKFFDYSEVINELFDTEDPIDKRYCLIILGINYKNYKPRRNSHFIRATIDHLKNINISNKLTVWGGAHVDIRHTEIEPDSEKIQWHILNIMGINSYSIALNLDLNEGTFKKKLIDFKNKIPLKKYLFALAITHTKESEKKEKDQIIKKVLWFKDVFNIKLTTILAYIEDYSCDPIIFSNESDNADFKIDNKNLNIVSYLIISP